MVAVQHDRGGAKKKEKKEDELVFCPDAAHDAVGRSIYAAWQWRGASPHTSSR